MADFRQDLNRTAQDFTKVAQDAAYVAIGLGVIGFQKAQVARRELVEQLDRQRTSGGDQAAEVRAQVTKALKDFDKVVSQLIERADATLEPVSERLPEQAQQVVKQVREVRDQVREYIQQQLAA